MNGTCIVCKTNQTQNSVKVSDNIDVFVCHECLDSANDNIIFICMGCSTTYFRDKQHVIDNVDHPQIAAGLAKMKDEKMIFGITGCINCKNANQPTKEGNA